MNSDVIDIFTLNSGYVYHYFICPKINKRGVGIRAEGWKVFQKSIRWGGAIIRYSRVLFIPCCSGFKINWLSLVRFNSFLSS